MTNPETTMPSKAICPSCGSHEIKKSSAVVEQGTSSIDVTAVGVGLGTSGSGVGLGQARGQATTAAANANKQDDGAAQAVGCAGMLAMVFVIVVGLFAGLGFGLTILLSIVATIAACLGVLHLMKGELRKAAENYDRQWYCMACGHKFWR